MAHLENKKNLVRGLCSHHVKTCKYLEKIKEELELPLQSDKVTDVIKNILKEVKIDSERKKEKERVETILRHLVSTKAISKFEFDGDLVRIYPKYPLTNILKEVKIDSERNRSGKSNGKS